MPDELPPEWRTVKLSDVAVERKERVDDPANSDFDRYVGSDDLERLEWRVRRWRPSSEVTSTAKVFHSGDYLFVRRSLYASDFRERAARADFSGLCSGDILPLREKPGVIAPGFLGVVLNTPRIWEYVVKHATGSITRRIKWRDLSEYRFRLPPLEKQRRIVAGLEHSRTVEMALDAAIEASSCLPNSILSDFLTTIVGSDKPYHFRTAPLAKSTRVVRAGDVLRARQGLQISQRERSREPGPGRHPYLTVQYLLHGGELEYVPSASERVICHKRDILVVRTGMTNGAVFTDKEGAFHNNFFAVDYDDDVLERDFVVAYLRHPNVHHLMQALSGATNIPDLNHGEFYSIPFPVPPPRDQRMVIDYYRAAQDAYEALRLRGTMARATTQAMIRSAMKGS